MNEIIAVGAAQLMFVFFKAFQQRNVAFLHYWWILPVSFCMSATEVLVLALVAVRAVDADNLLELLPFAVSLGVGGGIGAIGAMWAHHKYLGER